MKAEVRFRRLALAALAALAAWTLALVQIPLFFGTFPHHPHVIDFANYLVAAEVGRDHGWSHIYDPQLQAPAFLRLSGFPRFEWLDTFVSPPPVAWLALPLTFFPVDLAYWTWAGLSAVALAVACWRVNPWDGLAGMTALLVGAGLYPVLIALQFGQVTPFIAAATAGAWWLLRQGRQAAAGVLLLAVVFKPQVGVLIPVALGLAGYRRCFAVWAAGAGALAAASILTLGGAGLVQYLADLRAEQAHLDNQVWTLALLLGPGPVATTAELLCAAATLLAGWRARGSGTTPLVAGALGSLLGAGYHHSIDFPSLLPLALIQLWELPRWIAAPFCVLGVAACYLTPHFGPAPLLVFAVAWLLLVVLQAFRPWSAAGKARPIPAAA